MMIRRTKTLVWVAVLFSLIGGFSSLAVAGAKPTPQTDLSPRDRFVRDTVYHILFNIRDTSVTVYYGSVPLVGCRWHAVDRGDAEDFAATWRSHPNKGWQSVLRRQVWAGRPAVSDTIIDVISRVSSVDPELIRRVLPSRFEVYLTENLALRIMTPEGALEDRPFAEAMKEWWARWRPWNRRTTLDLIVTSQDAQTLYYALEPGTPVLVANPAASR